MLIGVPLSDADLLYLSGFKAPDTIGLVIMEDRKFLFVSDLEFDRARKESKADQVLRYMEIQEELKKKGMERKDLLACISFWLERKGIKGVVVPGNFPFGHGEWLRKQDMEVTLLEDSPAPQRRRKSREELERIIRVQRINEEAVKEGIRAIKTSKPGRDGTLMLDGEPLTSERVKSIIQKKLVEHNCFSFGTIVAGGREACDPHNEGSGPLFANTFIIVDVFPRSLDSLYHADMTRTVINGEPTPEKQRLYDTVKKGQELGISMARPGTPVRDIHKSILELFEANGFHTGLINGRMQGFFHGTGHGVGLAIHEAPRISDCDGKLEEGDVITVEPGLYYEDFGGVRIEDMVYVSRHGPRVITNFEK